MHMLRSIWRHCKFSNSFNTSYLKATCKPRLLHLARINSTNLDMNNGVSPQQLATEGLEDYQECVKLLNGLQTNARVIEQAVKTNDQHAWRNIPETSRLCEIVGVTPAKINALNVIHVAGSKGKGSTCAFIESILREHGYRTGFYSSPHLLEVRERVRINGKPLSYARFSEHFRFVYSRILEEVNRQPQQISDSNANAIATETQVKHRCSSSVLMPAYFKFLTVLALHVFVAEEVDVAILEVGIGGRFDCTNIIEKPRVCAVTSLGYDHVALLGDTIDKIAFQKGGIFKPGALCLTVPQGDALALQTLAECAAKQCNAPVYVVPTNLRIDDGNGSGNGNGSCFTLGIKGEIELLNASLATFAACSWMELMKSSDGVERSSVLRKLNVEAEPLDATGNVLRLGAINLTEKLSSGLGKTRWMGRYQTIETRPQGGHVTYLLDGAHTVESIELCLRWFVGESERRRLASPQTSTIRVLAFNCTGERNNVNLLSPLAFVESNSTEQGSRVPIDADVEWQLNSPHVEPRFVNTACKWRHSYFVCNVSYSDTQRQIADNVAMASDTSAQKKRCETLRDVFVNELKQTAPAIALDSFDQLHEAVRRLAVCSGNDGTRGEPAPVEVHVLVTGSLHLVGCGLQVLRDHYPEAFMRSVCGDDSSE